MNALAGELVPAFGLFAFAVGLTGWAFWVAARLAPWFLKESFEPPTVRSFFFEPMADVDITRGRLVTTGIATAIVLAAVLSFVIAAKLQGWSPN
jgi:hypothetical protein